MDDRARHDWVRNVQGAGAFKNRFWGELWRKKAGLYGQGISTSTDTPIDLVKHPWALNAAEFASALSVIRAGSVPTLPDDRIRIAAVLAAAGAIARALAVPLALVPATAPAAGVVGAGGTITGGAAAVLFLTETAIVAVKSSAIIAKIREYQAIYEKEADYRAREVT